ncbi:ubiquitin C-terminal hydrolase L3 [Dothidotthia symphoricarpi CBS 119687]|uniref:Ubiquitin carboxyl-terminal hydrolase n=1 Tax=Dothidotthia symphoricarpi CBS 119687 TaxID=1392245 RepID=A0A6A6A0M3_9PLEO|nr:ubiquitin C-terminal hydrolase L3 [Dothidotthia symphoricarpi CBS 119687]KAF2124507.1 ubiquitin C-terminal hydrolase L3 [Dothidotthia symphoricarpi CBS 119687]
MASSPTQTNRKHFIPLESNPDVFTELVHKLGLAPSVYFQDVLSLDDPELLAFVPRPAHALILVFPTTEAYEKRVRDEDGGVEEYEEDGVVFFRQTINNACGLYAILNAVCNGEVKGQIRLDSVLGNLLSTCIPLKTEECARVLEDSQDLEHAYAEVARKGDTEAPVNPEDEVDFHYVAFVKSDANSHLYQLDGDRKRPIDLGLLDADADALSDKCLDVIRRMITGERGNLNFSLMALVSDQA